MLYLNYDEIYIKSLDLQEVQFLEHQYGSLFLHSQWQPGFANPNLTLCLETITKASCAICRDFQKLSKKGMEEPYMI